MLRIGREQRLVILRAQAEADSLGLDAAAAKLLLMERLKAHEERLLGGIVQVEPGAIREDEATPGRGAASGGLTLVVAFAALVVGRWGLGGLRALQRAGA